MTVNVLFFTTVGCHLCEQAEALLDAVLPHANGLRAQSGLALLQLQKVEVSENASLVERYGSRIPVLLLEENAQELAWPFEQTRLFGFLSGFTG